MKQEVLHYPRLDTMLKVEAVIKKAKDALSKNEIDRRLSKQIMRPTLNLILEYLEESGKIVLLKQGIIWIHKKDISRKLKAEVQKAIPILKKNDVIKAGIFGSFARGEERKDSDIDILVKLKGRKGLLDIVRLERELREVLGRKVDLLTYKSIRPYLKERILDEEIRIL
jgi:uncharacterized protein